jgi:hypothetical protein
LNDIFSNNLYQESISVAVQEPGDMLFFPPLWGHTVITSKGPNVMLNLRQVSIMTALTSLWNGLEPSLGSLFMTVFDKAGNKVYSHTKTKRSQYLLQSFDAKIVDSPCKNLWKKMLHGNNK